MGIAETKARVYWDLLQKFKEQKKVTPQHSEDIKSTVIDTLKKIQDERKSRAEEEKKERVLIIDGLNMFIRSWAAVPTMDTNGEHVGGVIGFLRSLKSLTREIMPSQIIVVWDGEGGSKKRKGIFAEYKAGRKPKVNRQYDFETPEASHANLQLQYQRTKQCIDLLGITQIEVVEVEADDVIGYICKQLMVEKDKIIVSTDKDFLQLIDIHTAVWSPIKKLMLSTKEILNVWGVLPENFVYMRAMSGASDASDNIGGIKGFGNKTIVKLFPFLAERPSSLDEILSFCEERKEDKKAGHNYRKVLEHKDVLFRNVKLMRLDTPIFSIQSSQKIRYILDQKPGGFQASELKIKFLKDGIQLTDADFFSVFQNYQIRVARRGETKNERE